MNEQSERNVMKIEFYDITKKWYVVDPKLNLALAICNSREEAIAKCKSESWEFELEAA